MAWTYDITRRNLTKQRKDRRDKQTRSTNKHQNTKIFARSYTVFCEIHTEPIRENRQHETTTQKRDKWERATDRNSDFNEIKQELTSLPCLAHYNRNKENIVTTDACKTGLGIALWQKQGNGELKPIAFASRYLNDAEKNILSENKNY